MRFQILISCIIFQLISTLSTAQNCGEVSLDSAKYMYSIGRFYESIDMLKACLYTKGAFTADEKIRAYRYLAMCYLAIDSTASADNCIEELLALKDNFEPDSDDPPRFKNELEAVRMTPRGVTVSSISKRNEDIRVAPATVMVITQEKMLQR